MTSKHRYKTNAAYREAVKRDVIERHRRDVAASENYRKLVALRKQRYGIQERIKHWQSRIGHAREKLVSMKRDIEILELAWGKERADRKRRAMSLAANA